MMLIGSSIKVAPVVQWDGQAIGDGKPGRITKKLLEMWNEDARSAQDQMVPVPYPGRCFFCLSSLAHRGFFLIVRSRVCSAARRDRPPIEESDASESRRSARSPCKNRHSRR